MLHRCALVKRQLAGVERLQLSLAGVPIVRVVHCNP
jgi:hypothetical protein